MVKSVVKPAIGDLVIPEKVWESNVLSLSAKLLAGELMRLQKANEKDYSKDSGASYEIVRHLEAFFDWPPSFIAVIYNELRQNNIMK